MQKSRNFIWNFMPKAIVGLFMAILTSNAYGLQTEICKQSDCPTSGVVTEENTIWSHIDPALTPAYTHTCYLGVGSKWLRITSVAGDCPQGTSKVQKSHYSTLCQKTYTYYDCQGNNCTGCPNCTSDTTWSYYAEGYEKQTTRICNYSTCECEPTALFRCAQGYYGSPHKTPSGCTRCPMDDTNSVNGTTSSAGSTRISSCYIPSGASFSDTSGSGVYPDQCDYTIDIDVCAIGDAGYCTSDIDCSRLATCNTLTNCCEVQSLPGIGDIIIPELSCSPGQSNYCDSSIGCSLGYECVLTTNCCVATGSIK